MGIESKPVMGLIIRAEPYRQRAARSQLDVALVAAAMDCQLELYFVGSAVLQLLLQRDATVARLPAAYRGWASLPEMTEVSTYAEPRWTDWLAARSACTALDIQAMSPGRMRREWRRCSKVLVL